MDGINRLVLAVAIFEVDGIKILVSLPLCHSLLKWAYFKDLLCCSFAIKN